MPIDQNMYDEKRKKGATQRDLIPGRPLADFIRSKRVQVVVALLSLGATAGCTAGREFRAAALPAVQSGTLSIATGLLDGLFAAIAPQPQTTTP